MTNYEKIKMLCAEKGVSERFLSAKCGVSPTYIKTYRLSDRDLPSHILPVVAQFLGTTVDYLTDETDDPRIPGEEDDETAEYLEQLRNRSEMKTLFSVAKGATKEEIEQAVKIIEALRRG